MEAMITSQRGIDLIKKFEGFSAHPYVCPAGKMTVGYGHVLVKGDLCDSVSEEDAEDILRHDLGIAENAVSKQVEVPLTQNQFDALVSFTFNLGAANLRGSTLLRLLNSGNYVGAARQFERWRYIGTKPSNGLLSRRKAERDLFMEA